MTPDPSTASKEGRIIQLRPRATSSPASTMLPGGAKWSPVDHISTSQLPRADIARHYLKFMLPAIPIASFISTFVFCSLLFGMMMPTQPEKQLSSVQVDPLIVIPALPFICALMVSIVTGALCLGIYVGYRRIYDHSDETFAR